MELKGKRAVVVCSMLGQRGGGWLAPLLLCRELARLESRVTCLTQLAEFSDGQIPKDFRIVTPWVKKGCRWDLPGKCLAWQARRWIRRERPDFVFVAGVAPLTRYLLETDVAGQVLVWEFTNANPGNKFVDTTAAGLLGRSRAVLSPTPTIDRNIRETYGYQGRILRLPFWIEDGTQEQKVESRKQKSHLPSPISYLPSSPTDFIYLGRRDVEKGIHQLVRATAEVARRFPKVRVLIAGQGSEAPFAATARELGITENVLFHYIRTRQETMDALANSRCLVLPSYHEGYPLVLLEAARCGVPSIATTVGSIPEMFANSRAAVLVPPRDVSALAETMRAILSESPANYEERRKAAVELFARLSSAEAIRTRLKILLQQLDTLVPGAADR
jgi:glycosyltransferase involved in cell wall biosynthesis